MVWVKQTLEIIPEPEIRELGYNQILEVPCEVNIR